MILFPNATVYIADETTTKNSEGTKIKTYDFTNPKESFRADVQPNTLSQAQIQLYGIDEKTAETKKCFFDYKSVYAITGNRMKVVEDDGTEKIYNIHPVNKWRFHNEVLLVPVENEI